MRDDGLSHPPRAYLDHASTSPLRPEGRAALLEWLGCADPGRVHSEGRRARDALERARAQVAAFLGTRPRQVVFTSGATEAVHAAVHGACARWRLAGGESEPLVVAGRVEHACVREASDRLGNVVWVGADSEGRIDVDALTAALGRRPALVHCQWANHEVGTLQPVREVVAACRQAGVTVHVDAAAAGGHVAVDFDRLGADLLSVSAHKMGGPAGVGALLVRRGLRFPPLLVGGSQERARRAGMENVAAAAAWGAVAETLGAGALEDERQRAAAQTERLRRALAAMAGVRLFGPADPAGRLPHIVCAGVDGVEAEAVLVGLDGAGVAAHSGSACASEDLEPSPVLAAMGVDATHSLRLSVGWSTADAEVDMAAGAFNPVVSRLRELHAAGGGLTGRSA